MESPSLTLRTSNNELLKESLIKSIKFCWLTRHQILGINFQNGRSLQEIYNNGGDAL